MVSEDSLTSLYQIYHNLKYFGHYTIFEVDDMIPYERGIFFSLLKKTIEEAKKQQQR